MRKLFFMFGLMLAVACSGYAESERGRDGFFQMSEVNKASLVMLAEQGIVSKALARNIANGVTQVIQEEGLEGHKRSANYLYFEMRLLEIAGAEASRIHTGRSRQDTHGTARRMLIRESLLKTYNSMLKARKAVLSLAEQHVDTVIPAYTHGVQAQPTTMAHYLLAFSAAFERDAARLEQAYLRVNQSPLGSAALGTSGFALKRERLANLLGFDSPVENSYDANLVSSAGLKIEFANVLGQSSIHVGQLMENIHTQYHNPKPWMLLGDGQTSISTIMPQKSNPRPIDRVRTHATAVLAQSQAVSLFVHNTNTGMHDYRVAEPLLELAERARKMYSGYAKVVANLRVDKARALEELNNDYSTMTEVADVLLRHADIPFRSAHHYASELTKYGRSMGTRPLSLSDEELLSIYKTSMGEDLPINLDLIKQAMDPVVMVSQRKGLGGPQVSEVKRMLKSHRKEMQNRQKWLNTRQDQITNSLKKLNQAFNKLK